MPNSDSAPPLQLPQYIQSTQKSTNLPVGRFAPSPTGELHLGSVTTAIASYCHIKSLHGRWLVRMEDTDTQRCKPEFSQKILTDLDNLGLHWDDGVIYQSTRRDLYEAYLQNVLKHVAYACDCSRKDVAKFKVYPRYCLSRGLPWGNHKVRVQMPNKTVRFFDNLQGWQAINPQQTHGDVVVRRADGTINYLLAVSVDDALQGITHVVRGLDILPLTPVQITLMSKLELPTIEAWYHLPLVNNTQGQKLSKQNLAKPIDTSSIGKSQALIQHALMLLKQPKVQIDKPTKMLSQAVSQWDESSLQNKTVLGQADF